MTVEDLLELIDEALRALGSTAEPGEEFRAPALTVLRYGRRPVRVSRVPWLGRALSLVAVARQPTDLGFSAAGYGQLLRRLAMAANGRFPPWGRKGGLTIGLTAVILTPEPIGPGDDDVLRSAFADLSRMRTVPLGILRLNLGQEAMALALARGPGGQFPEPEALADALTPRFRRFVPLLEL